MIDILRWTAAGIGIVAAIMVSLNAGPRVTGWGFVVFTASSLSWTAVGLADDKGGLLLQNMVLTVINVVGIYRYLIAKQES